MQMEIIRLENVTWIQWVKMICFNFCWDDGGQVGLQISPCSKVWSDGKSLRIADLVCVSRYVPEAYVWRSGHVIAVRPSDHDGPVKQQASAIGSH